MNSDDRFLYDQFITALFESNSCLTDLVFLKDYRSIRNSKIEDDADNEVKGKYVELYQHHVNAEKMKRYIEQNMIDCYAINEWDLFIKLRNGDEFIFDSYRNAVSFDLYKNGELTDEEERREFTKNLKKLLDRNYMTQEELANKTGISRLSINNYINGKQLPDAMKLRKMAKALGCSTEDFFYKKY